jgi:hypothetical protein
MGDSSHQPPSRQAPSPNRLAIFFLERPDAHDRHQFARSFGTSKDQPVTAIAAEYYVRGAIVLDSQAWQGCCPVVSLEWLISLPTDSPLTITTEEQRPHPTMCNDCDISVAMMHQMHRPPDGFVVEHQWLAPAHEHFPPGWQKRHP